MPMEARRRSDAHVILNSWSCAAAKWHKRGTCAARGHGVSPVGGFVVVGGPYLSP